MKINTLPAYLLVTGLLLAGQFQAAAQTAQTYSTSSTGYSASIGITGTYDAGYTHSFVGLNAKRVGGSWVLGTDAYGNTSGGGNNGGALLLGGITGEFRFFSFPTRTASNTQTFSDADIAAMTPQMVIGRTIDNTGTVIKPVYVRIGERAPSATSPHADYALSVYGKIVGTSLYVTATNWADYVFDKEYHLRPLPELEAYVQQNKHLPEVPTTCEVEEAGVNVGAINTLLLKKVEELTLYVIELNKRNERVEADMAALRAQVAQKH